MTDSIKNRSRKIHSRSQMLSGSDNDIQINEYEKEFIFLKLSKSKSLRDVDEKKRYIFVYYLRRIVVLSMFSLLLSFILWISVLSADNNYISRVYNGIGNFRDMWPWNESLQWQLNSSGRMAESDQEKFVIGSSLISFVWILWFICAVYYGLLRKKYFDRSINIFISIFAVASAIAWLSSSYGLFDRPSAGPSTYDNISILLTKMTILISFSYFLSGVFIFSLLTRVRDLTRSEEHG